MKLKTLYRVTFVNQERIYEVYARKVYQSDLFGFIAIEQLVYGETSSVVVDPGQERLKSEFVDVKCTYIPMHSVLRIDEVEKEGIAKITIVNKENNVSPFPSPIYTKPPEKLN
ncbi:MAG: DUF1820 family protein [Pseudomonadota bacterium]